MAVERHRYLVGYDIRDEKRLRRVHKIAKSYGWPMQLSVFVCDLDHVELMGLKADLAAVMHHAVDSVAIVDVGDPRDRGKSCFDFLGVAPVLPTTGPLVL